jgi:hypothetical protein
MAGASGWTASSAAWNISLQILTKPSRSRRADDPVNEAAIADLISSQKVLLTAQVVLTDKVDKLAVSVSALTDAGKRIDDRLKALVGVVDIVRRENRVQPLTLSVKGS